MYLLAFTGHWSSYITVMSSVHRFGSGLDSVKEIMKQLRKVKLRTDTRNLSLDNEMRTIHPYMNKGFSLKVLRGLLTVSDT